MYVKKMTGKEEEKADEVPAQTRFSRTPNRRRTITSVHFMESEIDIIRRDIQEKDQQIKQRKKQVKKLNDTTADLKTLIHDLQVATGEELLTPDQKAQFDELEPHECVAIVRKSIRVLVKIHSELGKRFEKDFAAKATEVVEEMKKIEEEIEDVKKRKESVKLNNARLTRFYEMNEKERESLDVISNRLKEQLENTDREARNRTIIAKEQLVKVRKESKEIRAATALKKQRNGQLLATVNAPLSKQLADSIKEDFHLTKEINNLQRLLEREYDEHSIAEEELEHTLSEIKCAKKVIEKYKLAHRPESMSRADQVNKSLRIQIEEQRDKSEWDIKNQVKRNKELERQKLELQEEESMLQHYLELVEKRLAAQMLKLPTLAQIQHRGEPEPRARVQTRKNKRREPDDLEMRTIKRAISQLQQQRRRAPTSFK